MTCMICHWIFVYIYTLLLIAYLLGISSIVNENQFAHLQLIFVIVVLCFFINFLAFSSLLCKMSYNSETNEENVFLKLLSTEQDILYKIISELETETIVSLGHTCKKCKRIFIQFGVWKRWMLCTMTKGVH